MFRKIKPTRSKLTVNKSYVGERIEQKINRIVNNKEPIKDGAPLVYTDRSEGVKPETDIRTDRFEIAAEAMDKVTKAKIAQREHRKTLGEQAKEGQKKESKTDKTSESGETPANTND